MCRASGHRDGRPASGRCAAVEAGKFHVFPVRTIDDGIEILTGIEAGTANADGRYPEGTVHGLVDQELQRLAKGLKEFTAPAAALESRAEKKKKKTA